MELQNNYKIIYDITNKVTEDKPNRLYASKTSNNIVLNGKMLTAYNCEDGSEIDFKTIKLVYTDNENLIGSTTNVPTSEDVKFYLADENGDVVFGKSGVVPPVEEFEVTTNEIENCTISGAGVYEYLSTATVSIKPNEGFVFVGVPSLEISTLPDPVTPTLLEDSSYAYSFYVEEDTSVVFVAEVVEQ